MRSSRLAADYVHRAEVRVQALQVLFAAESWADVVRESQEIVELALKGLLRACGIEPPRIHDVSDVLIAERGRLPAALRLRRDRELAFYGAEDLTPSGFYSRRDAEEGKAWAERTVALVAPHVPRVSGP
jgi:HEPN domain-containing protein